MMNRDQFKHRMEDVQGHYISPDQLCIGLYVHLDLGWMQHPFTFSNFKIKDDEQIRKIRALNLRKIRYDPNRSDVAPVFSRTIPVATAPQPVAAPEPVAPPDPIRRAARLKQLNAAVLETEQAYFKNAGTVRAAVRNLPQHPEQSRATAETLINRWVDSVITEGDVALHAISSSDQGHENYVHPFNVTVLALMLAKSLDVKAEDAATVGMAAMFHDVGKDEQPRNKSFMDMHCTLGASIAERAGMSERVARIIREHHEYVDGSGFPLHLKGDSIDPLARLLALVNHFDNLCNPADPDAAMTPYEALATLYANLQHKFDATMLKVLVRSLGVYPPGSIVQLSNDMYGAVLTTNPDKPMLPLVMLHMPKVSRDTPVIIDLSEEKGLMIKRCLRPETLPREVLDYLKPRKRMSYYFMKKSDTQPPQPGAQASPTGDGTAGNAPAPLQRQA